MVNKAIFFVLFLTSILSYSQANKWVGFYEYDETHMDKEVIYTLILHKSSTNKLPGVLFVYSDTVHSEMEVYGKVSGKNLSVYALKEDPVKRIHPGVPLMKFVPSMSKKGHFITNWIQFHPTFPEHESPGERFERHPNPAKTHLDIKFDWESKPKKLSLKGKIINKSHVISFSKVKMKVDFIRQGKVLKSENFTYNATVASEESEKFKISFPYGLDLAEEAKVYIESALPNK